MLTFTVSVKKRVNTPMLRSSTNRVTVGGITSSTYNCTGKAVSFVTGVTSFPLISEMALAVKVRKVVFAFTASMVRFLMVFASTNDNLTSTTGSFRVKTSPPVRV